MNNKGKRMKSNISTIFITDQKKDNVSLIKKREKNNGKNERSFFVKVIKKNQIIMFSLALFLICGAYFAYTPTEETNLVSTTLDNTMLADIGDATFVSSSQIIEEIEKFQEAQEAVQVSATPQVSDEYFINSKLDREKMYSEMLETYQNILDSSTVNDEQKNKATTEISRINKEKQAIMIMENLIKNKGLEDVLIFINNESVSVVVKAKELKDKELVQIQNIVTRELDVEMEKVNVSKR